MGAMRVQVDIEVGTGGRFNYVVTTTSGYRATMERCDFDGCAPGGWMSACARPLNEKHMHSSGVGSGSVDLWLAHSAKFCHGWHDERVRIFVAEAIKVRKAPANLTWVAREMGWLIEDLRDELAKAAA